MACESPWAPRALRGALQAPLSPSRPTSVAPEPPKADFQDFPPNSQILPLPPALLGPTRPAWASPGPPGLPLALPGPPLGLLAPGPQALGAAGRKPTLWGWMESPRSDPHHPDLWGGLVMGSEVITPFPQAQNLGKGSLHIEGSQNHGSTMVALQV